MLSRNFIKKRENIFLGFLAINTSLFLKLGYKGEKQRMDVCFLPRILNKAQRKYIAFVLPDGRIWDLFKRKNVRLVLSSCLLLEVIYLIFCKPIAKSKTQYREFVR